jgi:hypothetical protein
MADIRPLGSERLDGIDKIKRIMEIAKYKDAVSEPINENSTTEYSITFADGNQYGIVKERQGYIIKQFVTEGQSDYIEPMKNRKYFSGYSQALRKLNLMIKENNSLVGNDEELSLFGEQKKFVLKTPKPEIEAPVEQAPPMPAAPPLPEPELPAPDATSPEGDVDAELDMDLEMGGDQMDAEMDVQSEPMDQEQVTFKTIQKLTGKLTQKIRQFGSENDMSSEDIKYVINMVLSSVDLDSLSFEDKDEILGKFESDEEGDMADMGGDDMGGEDLTDDSEVEDIQADMDIENDADMVDDGAAGFGKVEADEQWQAAIAPALERMAVGYVADKAMDKVSDMFTSVSNNEGEIDEDEEEVTPAEKSILDHLFSESKVDKVLSKYFEVGVSEKKLNEEKRMKKKLQSKHNVVKVMESVKKISETVEQELASEKFLEENIGFYLVGKTNKKNLVFEHGTKQTKISPEGLLV